MGRFRKPPNQSRLSGQQQRRRRVFGPFVAPPAASLLNRARPMQGKRVKPKPIPRIIAQRNHRQPMAIGSRPSGSSLHFVQKLGRGKVRRPPTRRAQTVSQQHMRTAMGIGSGRRAFPFQPGAWRR